MFFTKKVIKSVIALAALSTVTEVRANELWYPSQSITQKIDIKAQPLSCPTIGSDYSQMISHLESLQDKISKEANCEQLVKNLEGIGQLTNERRRKFLDAIAKINEGQAINDKDMQNNVIKYAEDVTTAVGTLATLLSESGQCFGKEDVSDSLFALSSFVNEASALVSTVAGPWGPAIAIGGKVVAGFLSGVKKLIASMPGYDFNDEKDWKGYVETVCAFHEQQDEIHALIHPEEAVQGLATVQQSIDNKLNKYLSTSRLGTQLVTAYKSQDDVLLSRLVEEMNGEFSGLGLNSVRLLTARNWIEKRIETIISESNDPLAPGQYLVQKQRDEIEEFLIARQGPKFLNFQVSEAERKVRDLESFITYDGHMIYNQISYLDRAPILSPLPIYPDTMEVLKNLLTFDENKLYGKSVEADQAYSSLVHFKREVRKKWDAINISYGVKISFCAFFESAGYYSLEMNNSCTSRRARLVEANIGRYKEAGMMAAPPTYLRKLGDSRGLSWSDALKSWVNELN